MYRTEQDAGLGEWSFSVNLQPGSTYGGWSFIICINGNKSGRDMHAYATYPDFVLLSKRIITFHQCP